MKCTVLSNEPEDRVHAESCRQNESVGIPLKDNGAIRHLLLASNRGILQSTLQGHDEPQYFCGEGSKYCPVLLSLTQIPLSNPAVVAVLYSI